MPSKDSRPNILFILTDDQGPWAMGCAGNDEIQTPNLDRLAATGIRFDQYFCTSPVCSPARASLLTGRIPSQHGIHDWLASGNSPLEPHKDGRLVEYLRGQRGYTEDLAEAGYVCGLSGKWHLGNSPQPQKGFAFWEVHAQGGGPYYNAPMIRNGQVYREPRYVTDAITENALEFLQQQLISDQPFYLSVHYTAPHLPWGPEHHPKDLYDIYFNDCAFDSVPDGLSAPSWVRYRNLPVDDVKTRRTYLSGYYTAVELMDANVGRLINWLEANGLRENTLIVFTSDNGMCMGHHGLYGKGNATFPLCMFEESVKVPFLVSQPGNIPQGLVCSNMVSHYDFRPTLLDYVGIGGGTSADLPGISFIDALSGDFSPKREGVVVFEEYGPVHMFRTQQWKYVHRYPYGPHELYNLADDPGETRNLIGDAGTREIEREMRQQLSLWFCQYVDPRRDGTREAVTGSGQLGPCGPDADSYESFSQDRVRSLLP
ncbi:MAG TPA: sulfatase-like hydrolase/transferase [bacterium]|nr:sulfatase-like hydrolase/transferase [bacterium]